MKGSESDVKMMKWHEKFIHGIWNVAKFANEDVELKRNYERLIKLYERCKTYEDFFYRTKEFSISAKYSGDALFYRKLGKIIDAIEKKGMARLWCYQQAILMAAAIKARYSEWNGKTFVPESKFMFKFWVGGRERNHVQLVIYEWKVRKMEPVSMDTHFNIMPNKCNEKARYINSIMWSDVE